MYRITFTLISVLTIMTFRANGQDCTRPGNVFPFNFQGKKYEVVKELYSWSVASLCAVERGGYLVHINSKAEQDTVFSSIINGAKVSTTYKPVSDGGGTSYVWIGATDKATEGKWLWDGNDDGTGKQFWTGQGLAGLGDGVAAEGIYNNWGGASLNPTNPNRRMEPDNYGAGQDCAAIALTRWPASAGGLGVAGEWNDIAGSSALYFVVEYDSTSTTHPLESRAQVSVFPNPATDFITISVEGTAEPIVEVRIYNLLGSIIYEKKGIHTFGLPVGLSGYPSGTYFINVILEQGRSERRRFLLR